MDRSEQEGAGVNGRYTIFMSFSVFSKAEGKGDCFSGGDVPSMILDKCNK
jgi:hypothetical protein